MNNASEYCPLKTFKISKVENVNTGLEVSAAQYNQYFQINIGTGLMSFYNIMQPIKYNIYIVASNGLVDSDSASNITVALLQVEYMHPKIDLVLPNLPPFFNDPTNDEIIYNKTLVPVVIDLVEV